MSTERMTGGMAVAAEDDAPDGVADDVADQSASGQGQPGLSDASGLPDAPELFDLADSAGGTAPAEHAGGMERRLGDRRQAAQRATDRQATLQSAMMEAARALARHGKPDSPGGPVAGVDAVTRSEDVVPKVRGCACGSRDVWLLHDGVLYLVGCRRCGRAGPGALSAALALDAWNCADEARFARTLPPDADMVAPCTCEAPHPDAGVSVSHPAHLRPLGHQVTPAPVRIHRLSLYGAQLSGDGEVLCPWLEGMEGAVCELAMPMPDGRGWILLALRVEAVRREGDTLVVGGGFVRQDDRQRGLLLRLLEGAQPLAGVGAAH